MEARFRHDFSHVRVHTDAKANESASAVGSRAFAAGRHVVFGPGAYRPGSSGGRQLIAHELTHVVQQGLTDLSPVRIGPTHDQFESEAEAVERGDDIPALQTAPSDGIQRDVMIADLFPAGEPGVPPKGMTGCHVILGGRGIEHWAGLCAGKGNWCVGAHHLYIDYFKGPTDFGVIEGGPLERDPTKSGAWVKPRSWEARGKQWKLNPRDACQCIDCLKAKTSAYHAAGHRYDPTGGPNSNSFASWVLDQCGVRVSLAFFPYVQNEYWRSHRRATAAPGRASVHADGQ